MTAGRPSDAADNAVQADINAVGYGGPDGVAGGSLTPGSAVAADATFCPQPGKSGQGTSFASQNHPAKFLRHYDDTVYVAGDGGSNAWDSAISWADDVSWAVGQPWA